MLRALLSLCDKVSRAIVVLRLVRIVDIVSMLMEELQSRSLRLTRRYEKKRGDYETLRAQNTDIREAFDREKKAREAQEVYYKARVEELTVALQVASEEFEKQGFDYTSLSGDAVRVGGGGGRQSIGGAGATPPPASSLKQPLEAAEGRSIRSGGSGSRASGGGNTKVFTLPSSSAAAALSASAFAPPASNPALKKRGSKGGGKGTSSSAAAAAVSSSSDGGGYESAPSSE
jgi:hypothetical protein